MYDTPPGSGDKSLPVKFVRAVEACELCPVSSQCARQALAEQPIGVIMAGIPLPQGSWWAPSYRQTYSRALDRIAAGEPMHAVVVEELCAVRGRERCASIIARRALKIRRGAALLPTPIEEIEGGGNV
ncbi:hypothetical protein [Corynebacterium hadale]